MHWVILKVCSTGVQQERLKQDMCSGTGRVCGEGSSSLGNQMCPEPALHT
jgi:hypothetical protein